MRGANREAREFWLLMTGASIILALIMVLRHRPNGALTLGVVGATFGLFALTTPRFLEPVQRAWMTFARTLGSINARVLLGVFYIIFVTPFGLLMRFVRRDEMEREWPARSSSNWKDHHARQRNERHYEHMF